MLFIDSADTQAIRELLASRVFAGVTTNPGILAKSGMANEDLPGLYAELSELDAGILFMQTWGKTKDAMRSAADTITALDGDIVVKVPSVPDGYALARELADEGTSVLMTMVYHPVQAALAAEVGAWGIAPYVGRMTDQGADWQAELAKMVAILSESETRILAASIRSRDVVSDLLAMGVEDVTMGVPIAREILDVPSSATALDEFEAIRP